MPWETGAWRWQEFHLAAGLPWRAGLTEYFLFPVGRLAKLTAAVLLAKDVLVYFFSTYVPTPFVVSHLLLLLYHTVMGVLEFTEEES